MFYSVFESNSQLRLVIRKLLHAFKEKSQAFTCFDNLRILPSQTLLNIHKLNNFNNQSKSLHCAVINHVVHKSRHLLTLYTKKEYPSR